MPWIGGLRGEGGGYLSVFFYGITRPRTDHGVADCLIAFMLVFAAEGGEVSSGWQIPENPLRLIPARPKWYEFWVDRRILFCLEW
jgi:hypothetical protein